MKIKMLIGVSGTFHGQADGVSPGDTVDVDDPIGARYCSLHYAEPVVTRKEERAVVETPAEVREAEEIKPEPNKPRPGQKPTAQ